MKKWSLYTSKEVKPAGWLKRQLELQASALSGNLHKIWPDVRGSKWIGGTAEGWERVPYWLDGFIPMAYLLEDESLISTAKKYMDAIISFQKPDGWLCPCEDDRRPFYDTVTDLWVRPLNKWTFDTHIVNLAMMLKSACGYKSEVKRNKLGICRRI